MWQHLHTRFCCQSIINTCTPARYTALGPHVANYAASNNANPFEELQAQLDWLASLPHRHKVVIAGNHDKPLDAEYVARFSERISEPKGQSRADLEWHDPSATLELANQRPLDLTIFGSPWTPPQCGTVAFQHPPIRDVWTGAVPAGTDVLLTHGPPTPGPRLQGLSALGA